MPRYPGTKKSFNEMAEMLVNLADFIESYADQHDSDFDPDQIRHVANVLRALDNLILMGKVT